MDEELLKALNKAKLKIMVDPDNTFLGSIMCGLDIVFDDEVPAACTNGIQIKLSPRFFGSLSDKSKIGLILHELWHIGRLHNLRCKNRDHETWNMACDIVINNWLDDKGYGELVQQGLVDHSLDNKSEEEIYDILKKDSNKNASTKSMANICQIKPNDVIENNSAESKSIQLGNVQEADIQTRKLMERKGNTSYGSGIFEIDTLLDKFFQAQIPWNVYLEKYLTDMKDYGVRSYKRPNRRYLYKGIYMASRTPEEGRLGHLQFYIDTSGSISQEQMTLYNTELRYIWEELRPTKMSIIQFCTEITAEDVLEDGDDYKIIHIVKSGGTSFKPVREKILKDKPICAIIFTDLYAEKEYTQTDGKVPLIWIAVDTTLDKDAVLEGKVIHLNTKNEN
jgi:predicted metal-dependent peptidase